MTSLIEQLQTTKIYRQHYENQMSLRQFLHKAKLSNSWLIGFESDAFFRIENRQVLLGRTQELHWLISKNIEQLSIREDLKMLEHPIEFLATFIKKYKPILALKICLKMWFYSHPTVLFWLTKIKFSMS